MRQHRTASVCLSRISRRSLVMSSLAGALVPGVTLGRAAAGSRLLRQATPVADRSPEPVLAIAERYMAECDLGAVIVQVRQGGRTS